MKGYTLIELLTTLTVAALLLAVGVPSFNSIIATNRAATNHNTLITALSSARTEAIKRGIPVTVCTSDPTVPGNAGQVMCTDSDWGSGYIVIVDEDVDYQVNALKDILSVYGPSKATSIFFTRKVNGGVAELKYLTYYAIGVTRNKTEVIMSDGRSMSIFCIREVGFIEGKACEWE